MRVLKKPIIWVGVMLAILAAIMVYQRWFAAPNPLYLLIKQADPQQEPERVRIPDEIVRKKDCGLYKQWFEATIPPTLLVFGAVSDRCPWAKIGPIAHFSLGGEYYFEIPRDYLYIDRYTPDGPLDTDNLGRSGSGICVEFAYPEGTPASPIGASKNIAFEEKREVTFKIYLGRDHIACRKFGYCGDIQFYEYIDALLLESFPEHLRPHIGEIYVEGTQSDYVPFTPIYDEELDLYETFPRFFVEGNVFRPSYWINKDTAVYDSALDYKGLYVQYYFQSEIVKHHRKIRQMILDKIDGWLVRAPK